MKRPLVTVGIVFFNRRKLLEEAVKSIFAQTFEDWELLLVDDGSTDGSVEWANSLRSKKVSVVSDGKNKRYPFRLNQIASLAKGEYIARMDDDDLSSPKRLEEQVKFLESFRDVDLVGTNLISMSMTGRINGKRRLPADHGGIVRRIYSGAQLAHATSMGRTPWFRKHRYSENVRLVADYDLWIRSYKSSRFANIMTPLYYYREGKDLTLKMYSAAVTRRITRMIRTATVRDILPIQASVIREVMKIGLCCSMRICGLQKRFFAIRYLPLVAEDLENARHDLETISKVELPLSF